MTYPDVIHFPFCSGFEQQVFLGWTPFQCVHQVHGLSVKQTVHPHLKLLLLDTPLVVDAVLLQDQLQFKEEKRIKVTAIAVWRSRGYYYKSTGQTRKGYKGVAKF